MIDTKTLQVPDDLPLLELMMSDMGTCDAFYRPTNYWATYEKRLGPELTHQGLRDFRRRPRSLLAAFGATDRLARGAVEIQPRLPGTRRLAVMLNALVERLPFVSFGVWGVTPEGPTHYFYRVVREKFDRIGLNLDQSPTTRWGNPEDFWEVNQGWWSTIHLQYCSMVADALRHIPFRPDSVLCELGSGLGRNVEVLARLFEKATFLAFDIPPQLYVAHQYLQSVFGPRVIPYREAVTLQPGPTGELPERAVGKIMLLPSWRLPAWSSTKIDVFWNSASFHEMEPDVVGNYIRLIRSMSPEWIYINAMPGGNYWGEWKPGRGGSKAPVTEQVYFDALSGAYGLQVTYPTDYFLRTGDHTSYIFRQTH